MNIEAIIFDMDGVLIDGEDIFAECCTEILNGLGIPCAASDFLPFRGMGERAYIGGVMGKYGAEYSDAIKQRAYEQYAEVIRDRLVYDGAARETVLHYKGKYKLSVASGADRFKVETNIRAIGLDVDDFDAVMAGDDILANGEVVKNKPDPEIFMTAAQKCGAACHECVVVEDSVSGIRAAKAAGMKIIGLLGTCGEEQLKEAGADWIIEKLADMRDIID